MPNKTKTNGEIFREEFLQAIKDADVTTLATYLNRGYTGKCKRCSNYFWDGNQASCYPATNLNESSCEKGIAEWMESYPDEDLQDKYHKKFWCSINNTERKAMLELTRILYRKHVLEKPKIDKYTKPCQQKGCPGCDRTETPCYICYEQIEDMYSAYINDKLDEQGYTLHDWAKRDQLLNEHPFREFVKERIVECMTDGPAKDKAMELITIAITEYKKEKASWKENTPYDDDPDWED